MPKTRAIILIKWSDFLSATHRNSQEKHPMRSILIGLMACLSACVWAASEQVSFPGAVGAGFPVQEKVTATLQWPAAAQRPVPAVVILHGSGGIDGRGAFHAQALNKSGIATLELFMFPQGGRFKGGHTTTLTHAYGALRFLASHPAVDSKKIGVMGFSWGGNLALRTASKQTHRSFFADGQPAFAAHAAYYGVWWAHEKLAKEAATVGVYAVLTGAPVLLVSGGKDDYGPPDAAQLFYNALPASASALMTLQHYPGATHGFDSPAGSDRLIFDPTAHQGKGGQVRFYRDADAAEDARSKTLAFFLKAFTGEVR